MKTAAIVTVLGSLLAAACSDERVYVGEDKLYQVAMTAQTAPVAVGEEGSLYMVETRMEVPIVRPPDVTMQQLYSGVSKYQGLPFPRLPWVERGDIELTVDFTLSNLDGDKH